MTIGNFKDGTHLKKTSVGSNFIPAFASWPNRFFIYILIDDVSLYELPNHTGTQNYTLCAGDSLMLGDTVNLPIRYQWSLNGVVIDTTKRIIVKPTTSATYVLQTKHCTTQTQTITVVINKNCDATPITEPTIPNVFTPNADGINDLWEFTLPKSSTLNALSIVNRWGLLIKNLELNTNN